MALKALGDKAFEKNQEIENYGVSTMLPRETNETPSSIIDRNFGDGFSEKLLQIPVGEWFGPVRSSFGVHLVFIENILVGEPIPLEEVKNLIIREMEYDAKETAKNQFFSELRNQYKIIYRGDAKKIVEVN